MDAAVDFGPTGLDASNEAEPDADRSGDGAQDKGDAEGSDSSLVDVADAVGADADRDRSVIDAVDGDGADAGCACTPMVGGFKTIPLDCFCQTPCPGWDCFPGVCPTYDEILASPCAGLPITPGSPFPGSVDLGMYDGDGVIAVSRWVRDGARTELVFDATTKTLIGAARSWLGFLHSPLLCGETVDASPPGFTVRAGRAPTATSTGGRTLCPPFDGGFDAGSDDATDDADAAPPDTTADGDVHSDGHDD